MGTLSYEDAPFAVREDLTLAHGRVWERLARPGTWLDGATRIAVAAEARQAFRCDLCRRRKEALSPAGVAGTHDRQGGLSDTRVEIVHRIVTDPARLTRDWIRRMLESGISEGEYVEIVAVIGHVLAVDTFARGLGVPPRTLPEPVAGEPSRYRPAEARQHGHWVSTIAWDEHGPAEADFFRGNPSNIRMAMTLVPDEARSYFALSAAQYLPGPAMRDFGKEYRAITHAQIEFLAARVSALNRCFY